MVESLPATWEAGFISWPMQPWCPPFRASLVAQLVKNLPAMRETGVPSLGWEDPLEEKWHLTPAFLLGESHGQRSLMSYDSSGHKELDPAEHLRT